MSSKQNIKNYYNKELGENLKLSEDFLELDDLDYMFAYFRLIHEFYGDSLDKEKLKEQFLNILQDLSLKINKEILPKYYKEFFGKEYKEGDTIPENKQEEWSEFIKNKIN